MIGDNKTNASLNNKNYENHKKNNSFVKVPLPNYISTVFREESKHNFGSKNGMVEESNFIFESNFNNPEINKPLSINISSNNLNESTPIEDLFLKQKEHAIT